MMLTLPVWSAEHEDAWYFAKPLGRVIAFTPSDRELVAVHRKGAPTRLSAARLADLSLSPVHPDRHSGPVEALRASSPEALRRAIRELRHDPSIDTVYPALVDHEGNHRHYHHNQLVVMIDPEVSQERMLSIIAGVGCEVAKEHWTPGFYTLTLGLKANLFPTIRRLNGHPEVLVAELNFHEFASTASVPNDEFFQLQWGLRNTGQYGGTPGADINILPAWGVTTGSPNVLICVIDWGFDLNHPDLLTNMVPGWNFVENNGNPTYNVADGANRYPHGTACAGIAAAQRNNAIGIAGVAPGCKWMPLRIDGSFPTIVDAINYTANFTSTYNGVVVSGSFSGAGYSAVVNQAVINAKSAGVTLCFSSGNNNSIVNYPAKLPETIAVGATSMCDERKSSGTEHQQRQANNGDRCPTTTSYDYNGVSCDLYLCLDYNEIPEDCYPQLWQCFNSTPAAYDCFIHHLCWGSNYGSELSVSSPGTMITTTDICSSLGYSQGDYYSFFRGTSAATPFVAGLAALVLSQWPQLTPDEVRTIIELTADKVGGYTYVNGRCNELGYGRINAGCALLRSPLFLSGPISGTHSFDNHIITRLHNASLSSNANITIETGNAIISGDFSTGSTGQLLIVPKHDFTCE